MDVKSFEVAEREILLYDTFLDMLLLRGIRGRPVLYNIRRQAVTITNVKGGSN